jgi:hypothetical protein
MGRPLLGAFVAQALGPRTPEQEASLESLFAERPVARALLVGTAGLALLNAATAAINFLLNLWMVGAPFGTGEFNSQVARVNALTRLTLGVPEFLVMGLMIWWVIYSLHSRLTPGCRRWAGGRVSGSWSRRKGRGHRRVLPNTPYSAYSSNLVEGLFSELRPHGVSRKYALRGVLRSSL